jgi:hypothetical protein
MRSRDRQKLLERAIYLTWTSLQSHMASYTPFDTACIKEYAEVIYILSLFLPRNPKRR